MKWVEHNLNCDYHQQSTNHPLLVLIKPTSNPNQDGHMEISRSVGLEFYKEEIFKNHVQIIHFIERPSSTQNQVYIVKNLHAIYHFTGNHLCFHCLTKIAEKFNIKTSLHNNTIEDSKFENDIHVCNNVEVDREMMDHLNNFFLYDHIETVMYDNQGRSKYHIDMGYALIDYNQQQPFGELDRRGPYIRKQTLSIPL